MNWDQIEDNWAYLQGNVRQHWGRLTPDDVSHVAGRRDELAARLRERYGIARGQAERDIDAWTRSLDFRMA